MSSIIKDVDRMIGDKASPEEGLLKPMKDLGIDDYHKYRVALEKARHEIRGEYERAKSKEATKRVELLEKYKKLHNWVKNEPNFDDKNKGSQFLGVEFTGRILTLSEKEQEIEKFEEFETGLRDECKRLDKELTEASLSVTAQNNNLANFLYDQSSTVSAVEQAEALNTRLQRSAQRRDAHDLILSALRGCHPEDDPERDAKEVEDVRNELRHLEQLEEDTDLLTDRLKVKLEAINLLEESQVEMVDFQVRKNSKLLDRIHEIENTVTQNNEELRVMREKMKAEFYSRLRDGRNVSGRFGRLRVLRWVLSFFIVGFLGFSVYYFWNKFTKEIGF